MFLATFLSYLVIALVRKVYAEPPAACHAPFRWDDCGKDPTPVMYYWKSGSRCEVGMWRGCLPNINMFPDEYECVATCIFAARAGMQDYHAFNELEEDSDETTKDPYDIHERSTLDASNETSGNDTETDETADPSDGGSNNDTTVESPNDNKKPEGETTKAPNATESAPENGTDVETPVSENPAQNTTDNAFK